MLNVTDNPNNLQTIFRPINQIAIMNETSLSFQARLYIQLQGALQYIIL